jgi:hypothetical protein
MTGNPMPLEENEDGGIDFFRSTKTQSLLIALVVVSLVAGPILVFQGIWSVYPWYFLLVFCSLVALESILTTRWLSRSNQAVSAPAIYAAEIMVALLVLRILTWFIGNNLPSRADLFQILRHPEAILDGFFIVSAFILVFVIIRAQSITGLFERLSLDIAEIKYSKRSGKYVGYREEHAPAFTNRQALMGRYYRGWALGGVLLIICAALSTFDFSDLRSGSADLASFRNLLRIGLRPGMLIALLVYFIGGFWLASEGRLAMLNARWSYEGFQVEKRVSASWRRYSLILLILIAVFAAILPIGSTIGLSRIIEAIAWVGFAIVGLIVGILSALYFLIISGLMPEAEVETQPLAPFQDIIPDIPQFSATTNDITTLVVGIIFWISLLAVSLVSIVYFAKTRDIRFEKIDLSHWWRSFVLWIREMWRNLSRQVDGVTTVLRSRAPAIDRRLVNTALNWSFVRLSNLSPRDKVRYFYLSTIRRAGDRGVLRQEAQTPSEYLQELTKSWPEITEEIDDLTESFITARYTDQPIKEREVTSARLTWKRIRSVLRKRLR